MDRVSTNWTLFLKFFLPVFWIVFFGAVTLTALFYKFEYIGDIPAANFRIALVIFYLSGLAMFIFTLMRLKRVEMDPQFVYVTNYFKNYRYPYHNIEQISFSSFLFLSVATIRFKTAGSFGKKIFFVPNMERFRLFLTQHPEVFSEVDIEGLK